MRARLFGSCWCPLLGAGGRGQTRGGSAARASTSPLSLQTHDLDPPASAYSPSGWPLPPRAWLPPAAWAFTSTACTRAKALDYRLAGGRRRRLQGTLMEEAIRAPAASWWLTTGGPDGR